MRTQNRIWQNHFHPAWISLFLLGVILSLMQLLGSRGYNALFLLQPLVLVGLGGWMLWLGLRRSGPKMQRLAKEFRGQMGGALIAIAGPALLSAWGPGYEEFAASLYLLGLLTLGASAFGSEFEHKTMSFLLSAPNTRGQIYRGKLIVLAVLTGIAAVNFLCVISSWSPALCIEEAAVALLLPIFAICTGPYLSLKLRSTLAAIVFMVSVPVALVLLGQLGISLVARFNSRETEFGELFGRQFIEYCLIALPLYAVTAAVWGWRTFVRLELRDGGGPEASGTHPLAKPLDRALKFFSPGGKSPLFSLIGKELRLQVGPWLLALVYLGLSLLTILIEWLSGASYPFPFSILEIRQSLAIVFGLLTLLFCGAACVAEERQLGALEWQLTLAMAMFRQWRIKVVTTLVLGLVLGVAWPLLLLLMSAPNGFGDANLPMGFTWASGLLVCIGVMGIGIYASTVSRNTVQAGCLSAVLLAGIVMVSGRLTTWWTVWAQAQEAQLSAQTRPAQDWWWAQEAQIPQSEKLAYLERYRQTVEQLRISHVTEPPFVLSIEQIRILDVIVCGAAILAFAWVVMRLARINFERGVPAWSDVFKQIGIIGSVLVLGMTTALGVVPVFNSWEKRYYMLKINYPELRPTIKSSAPAGVGLSEELAKRYGTPLGTNSTPAKGAIKIGGVIIGEELAKRYGLQIGSTGVRTQGSSKTLVTGVPDELAKRYGPEVGTNVVPAQGTEAK